MKTARQKGGLATLAKYGRSYYSIIGKRGGRPPLKSIAELLAERQQAPATPNISKKGVWPPNNLRELRGLFFSSPHPPFCNPGPGIAGPAPGQIFLEFQNG